MSNSELEKIEKTYKKVWKQRCKNFSKEPPISIIKNAPDRIIVIGDLHGDWNKTIQILKLSNVINDKNKWIGGDTIVVQLGDQVDRCRLDNGECHLKGATFNDEASDLKILFFLTELHNQAQKKGGAVYSILGNHELMNVDSKMNYVSRKNILQFSKKNLKKKQKFKKKVSIKYLKKYISEDVPEFSSEIEEEMIEKGMDNRKKLFSPGNPIANFLACTRKMVLVIGSNLFAHAGIIPEIANKYSIENMNQIVALYLFDKLKKDNPHADLLINSKKSPLWNRILGNLNKKQNQEEIDEMCSEIFDSGLQTKLLGTDTQRITKTFIGHTPQIYKGINSVCRNNKIYYVDVGLSDAFNFTNSNILQAAEIIGDEVRIIQPDN